MKRLSGLLLLSLAAFGAAGPALPGLQRVADLDLAAANNPAGLETVASLSLRKAFAGSDPYAPDRYLQAGVTGLASPAYAAAGLFGEWQPLPVLQLHVQGSQFKYFGTDAALLSLPGPDTPYGSADLDRRKDQARAGSAGQLQFQPVFQGQIGPVVFRHQATLAWYRFQGAGPSFYEPENDLLLQANDRIQDNLTQVLLESRPEWGTVLAGPILQTTRGRASGLFRRRIGLAGSWQAAADWGQAGRPRAYVTAARDQADRNRTGQIFLQVGIGTTWLR